MFLSCALMLPLLFRESVRFVDPHSAASAALEFVPAAWPCAYWQARFLPRCQNYRRPAVLVQPAHPSPACAPSPSLPYRSTFWAYCAPPHAIMRCIWLAVRCPCLSWSAGGRESVGRIFTLNLSVLRSAYWHPVRGPFILRCPAPACWSRCRSSSSCSTAPSPLRSAVSCFCCTAV